MSSISSATSPTATNPTLLISQLENDQYGVFEQVGKDEPQPRGRPMSEADLNQLLLAYGLKVEGGQLKSDDGFHVGRSAGGLAAVTNFSEQPPLPDVDGPVDPRAAGMASLSADTMSDGALMWHALSTLAHSSMQDMKDARQIRNVMQTAKREAKNAEIAATEKGIEAMKDAAWFDFAVSASCAAASCVLAVYNPGGAGWEAFGRGLGGAGSALGKAYNKEYGPEAKANQTQLETKRWELESQLFDELIEDAKSNYEESKELFKLALRVMQEHVERQTQAINTALRA